MYKLSIYSCKFRHEKYFYEYALFNKEIYISFILNIYRAYINLVFWNFKLDLTNNKMQITLQSRNITLINIAQVKFMSRINIRTLLIHLFINMQTI